MAITLILALLSLAISAYVFLGSLERPKKSELRELLEKQCSLVLKQYEQQLRALETEWDDMYQKFSRLAGRMDRQKALTTSETPPPAEVLAPVQPSTRSELLRRFKAKNE